MSAWAAKNPYSHLTAKQRSQPSFPTRELLSRGLIVGKVLDFGSGLGADARFLRSKGFDVAEYDPYYAPNYPIHRFDTILCIYVLNVLLPEEQSNVLMAVSELLEPHGRAFFGVRRDVTRDGFRVHAKHHLPVYQCRVYLPYRSVLRNHFCEIYEYRHYNQIGGGESNCPFCSPHPQAELITESATVYAMLDKYPVNPGHALIIPKHHYTDYFEMPDRTKRACWFVVDRVKALLTQRFNPDGFNIGVNNGICAGQTIPHVHIHLIPRYQGDTDHPDGGVRGVIPEKRAYSGPR